MAFTPSQDELQGDAKGINEEMDLAAEPEPYFLEPEIEAGLFDLALMFARSDNQTDATEYVDTLCSIRDCIENDIGDGTPQGLKTAAGQTGVISYTAGLLMSSVMLQRAQAVESGELSSYFPDGESRKDHYSLTHLK